MNSPSVYLPIKDEEVNDSNRNQVLDRLVYLQEQLDKGKGTGAEKQEKDRLLPLVLKYYDKLEARK
jgi:hypothetical protein